MWMKTPTTLLDSIVNLPARSVCLSWTDQLLYTDTARLGFTANPQTDATTRPQEVNTRSTQTWTEASVWEFTVTSNTKGHTGGSCVHLFAGIQVLNKWLVGIFLFLWVFLPPSLVRWWRCEQDDDDEQVYTNSLAFVSVHWDSSWNTWLSTERFSSGDVQCFFSGQQTPRTNVNYKHQPRIKSNRFTEFNISLSDY